MRTSISTIALACLICVSGTVSAKGCLKGAAVGGVGGHLLGNHAVLGAAAGCAVGTHQAKKKDREEAGDRQAARAAVPAGVEKSH